MCKLSHFLDESWFLHDDAVIIGVALSPRQGRDILEFLSLTPARSITDNARMAEHLVIERLEFLGRCGVTPEERQIPQPLAVDLELHYPSRGFRAAVKTDEIAQAIDYARVSERVVEVGTARDYALVETLAEHLAETLLTEFPLLRIRLWVRKLIPPVKSVTGSVGVRLERTQRASGSGIPARFLSDQIHLLPKGTILDVAAGHGRNALYLAGKGYTVEATDHDEAALASLAAEAERQNLTNVHMRTIDLEARPDIPAERYDGIVVFFFLFRPLVPVLVHALKPGGVLIYETFLIDNHLLHHHPRRREFCLAHNELLHLAAGLRILHYEEGERGGDCSDDFAFTARLVAQKEQNNESH